MSATTTPAPEGTAEKKAKGKGKLKLVLVLVVVLVLGAAAWFVLLRPSGETEVKPGEVVVLEPVQINLAEGHYLRIGVALQLVEGAHEVDGSQALDAVIELFSGRKTDEVTKPAGRKKLKEHLMHTLEESYHGEVMGVYFTEFVTQ